MIKNKKQTKMSKNSIRQTVKTVSDWRETLQHIKEQRAKEAARKRKYDKKVNIKK